MRLATFALALPWPLRPRPRRNRTTRASRTSPASTPRWRAAARPRSPRSTRSKKDGFKAVINLRMASEPGINMEQNQAKAKELGLNYVHIPFSAGSPDPKAVDTFLATIADKANQPVLMHCASAQRVGTMWLAKRVLQDNYSIEKATRKRTPSASATPASRSSPCSTSPNTRSNGAPPAAVPAATLPWRTPSCPSSDYPPRGDVS